MSVQDDVAITGCFIKDRESGEMRRMTVDEELVAQRRAADYWRALALQCEKEAKQLRTELLELRQKVLG